MAINNGYPYMREFDFNEEKKDLKAYVKINGEIKPVKVYIKNNNFTEVTELYVNSIGG